MSEGRRAYRTGDAAIVLRPTLPILVINLSANVMDGPVRSGGLLHRSGEVDFDQSGVAPAQHRANTDPMTGHDRAPDPDIDSDIVVDIRGLTKTYGDVEAVRGVDLQVRRGEVMAILGPNGAGKTTMVEILEGYRSRTTGAVSVLGIDPARGDGAWRSRLGIVHQSATASDELLVEEVIGFHAAMYPNPLAVGDVLERVGLTGKEKHRCSRLSGGQQRRIDVALGIVGRPEILFLDEPTTGLDPEARRAAWSMVGALENTTILLTTHYMEEAERLADRVAVLSGGRIVAEGTPADIGDRGSGPTLVRIRAEDPGLPATVTDLPDLQGAVSRNHEWIEIRTDQPTAVVATLTAWASARGVDELHGLEVSRPSLEDVYLKLTEDDRAGAHRTTPEPHGATR